MFLGKWLHTRVKDYIPRNCATREKWTHWKVVVRRERYNDCALISVEAFFFMARQGKDGRWISGKKVQIYHRVSLGNLNDIETRRRLLTNDDSASPLVRVRVRAELQSAISAFKEETDKLKKGHRYIDTQNLTDCIKDACLR
jgi:hypothetical protein